MVRSCLLITLTKCPKGHQSLEPLCSVVKTLIVSSVRQTKGPSKGQGHLLSCSRQLKSPSYHFGRLSSTENKVTKNKYTSYSPTRFRERFRRVFGCGKKKPLVRLVKEGQHGLFSFMFKSCSGKRKHIQAWRRQICVCHQYKPY